MGGQIMKFEFKEYHRNTSNDDLISDLKNVASKLRTSHITQAVYRKHGKFSPDMVRNRFGSWFNALQKAGLPETRKLNLKKESLLADLKKVAKKLGKNSLTTNDYREHGAFSAASFNRFFGTWNKALVLAGLNISKIAKIRDEDLLENLEEVWTKLGRQPKYNEMMKPLSSYSPGTYENRFGTWQNALKQFVAHVNQAEIENRRTNPEKITQKTIQKNLPLPSKNKTKRQINWRIRFLVMKRDRFKCVQCGRSPALSLEIVLHVDHVIPWSKGGETVIDNLQTLCSICNIGKSNVV